MRSVLKWLRACPQVASRIWNSLLLYCTSTVPILQHCTSKAPVLFQYCSNTVPVLSQYCSNTLPILFQYCSSSAPVPPQCCFSTVLILFQYCSSIVSVLFHYCSCTAPVLLLNYFSAVPIFQYCSSSAPVQYYTRCCTRKVPVLLQYCCSCQAQEEVCWVRCPILQGEMTSALKWLRACPQVALCIWYASLLYCTRVVPILFQYCFSTPPVRHQYCPVLFQYCYNTIANSVMAACNNAWCLEVAVNSMILIVACFSDAACRN